MVHENRIVDTTQLQSLNSPLIEDSDLISDSIPSWTQKGPIGEKKTKDVGDIGHDLGDTDDSLLTKLQIPSRKTLPTSRDLYADFQKLEMFPVKRFTTQMILVIKFYQTNECNPHDLLSTMKGNFCHRGLRNELVWITAGANGHYGVLCKRVSNIFRYLFKPHNQYSKTTMRLALVQMLQTQVGGGHLQGDSCLGKVS